MHLFSVISLSFILILKFLSVGFSKVLKLVLVKIIQKVIPLGLALVYVYYTLILFFMFSLIFALLFPSFYFYNDVSKVISSCCCLWSSLYSRLDCSLYSILVHSVLSKLFGPPASTGRVLQNKVHLSFRLSGSFRRIGSLVFFWNLAWC